MNILRDPMLMLLACLLLGWGLYDAGRPPPALPASVSDAVFSATRAISLLRRLYPDRQPHVSGSPQNRALRDRIVAALKRFGYTPEIRSRFHCRPEFARCSPVENIVAVKEGVDSGGAILLTAHYDSAWAGPGVADDGAGVAAVLEVARMASLQPEFSHDVIFLLSDGEEQGLIGADAFATRNPLFASVRAVINLDARGVSGASTMFETGEGNRGIIRMLARNLDRPVANSIAYEVYRRMPNDTDFSVYRAHGLSGVNFAFTGGAAAYHSSIDDLNHLDPGSLQHHGQNAWSMLLALDEHSLEGLTSSEDAVYIDLFGRQLLHYPLKSAVGLALILSIMVMLAIRRSYRQQVMIRQVFRASLSLLLLLIALISAGWLLSWPLGRWVDMHPLEHPYPWPGRLVLAAAVLWLTIRTSGLLAPRVTTGSIMTACWAAYILLALVLAFMLPAAGFIAVLPLLAFSLGLVLDGFRWKKNPRLLFAGLLAFLAASYLGIYYFFQLDVVLNFDHSELKILPLLLPAVAALPLLNWYFEYRTGQNVFSNVLLVLLAAGCVGQQFLPGYTPDVPRDMALMYRQEADQPAAWLILESVSGIPDPAYADKHGFAPVSLPRSDGSTREVLARPVHPIELPEIVEIQRTVKDLDESGKRRRYMFELDIPAGVRLLAFDFPERTDLSRAEVNSQLAFETDAKSRAASGHRQLVINHPAAGSNHFVFELAGGQTGQVTMTARFDLPPKLLQPFMADWPEDAEPAFLGHRVLQISHIRLGAD